MTQEELDQEMARLTEELRRLGIPLSRNIISRVKVNTRARRRLGCCYARPDGAFEIEVSARLLEDPAALRQTLCHELLHTCRGCRNHGETWKAYAARVNEALGTDIARLAPPEEGEAAPLRREEPKYLLRCTACGKVIPRARKSKAVKQPWRYRCPCGGKLEVLALQPRG